jgi:aspartate aminotransferase
MNEAPYTVPGRLAQVTTSLQPFLQFHLSSTFTRRQGEPSICDFVFGNPHEMPLEALVDAFQRRIVPQDKDWFAYKTSEQGAAQVVAKSLTRRRGLSFAPEDIALTNGAFAAIAICLAAVLEEGDDVIYNSPPWFFYEALILANNGHPVRVKIRPDNHDLDLKAIAAAITPRTRAIIVNSPNNPTGRIYPPETLAALGEILAEASRRNGRTIYLLSDEAYSRILYDGRTFPSPAAYYGPTFVLYTYGKTLLMPGQRLGYVAMAETMPDRPPLRIGLLAAQIINGYAFPNALLQHALPDLEELSIDIDHLQAKRDRLVSELRQMGYSLHSPEGTFYLLVRSPWGDDLAFCERLADYDIFCLPGAVFEMPGYFRISLTANDGMVERSLTGFELALNSTNDL